MSNNNLKNALIVVAEENYRPFKEAPKHDFSPQFESRMNQLIQQERRPFWHYTNTPAKRLFLTALVILLILTSLFSVSAKARDAVVHLIRNIENGHINYDYDTNGAGSIEHTVHFITVPDGLTEIDCQRSQMFVIITYQDTAGDTIKIIQGVNPTITVDTELHMLKQYTVGDKTVDLYVPTSDDSGYRTSLAVWTLGQYTVQLHISGNISEEQILSWVDLIELEK